MDKIVEKAIKNLKRNNMSGYYAGNPAELHVIIGRFLKEGDTIGCGDSVTLEQTGIFDLVREGAYIFYDKHRPGLSSQEKRNIYLKNFTADVFLTGANAVTAGGEIFNIDGNGSRVAPMLYGPKKVIIVVGTNKLTGTVEEAIQRSRQIAAPLDAERLGKETPCTKLGKCIDCRHPQRICNDFVLIARQFEPDRINVVFLEGTYGY